MVLDTHSNPLTPTYPKRAKQIAKQGRAEWVNESTIRMLAGSPAEMRAKDMPDETSIRTEWAEYFRNLAEQAVANDDLARLAIEAVRAAPSSPADAPGMAIASIVEVHQKTKAEIFRSLTEFTASMSRDEVLRSTVPIVVDAMEKVDSPWKLRRLKELAESLAGVQKDEETED